MPVKDIDAQLEKFKHEKYRKKRVRFYLLLVIAVMLWSFIIGTVVISLQPIDVAQIKGAESTIEVVKEEYGDTYIKNLEGLPTIGYEGHYKSIKTNYLNLVEQEASESSKNKEAVDLVAFVEFVQEDALKTSEDYSLSGTSKEFYKQHTEYVANNGEVYETLITLIESHEEGKGLTEEELNSVIEDLDARMMLFTNYLTTLKR